MEKVKHDGESTKAATFFNKWMPHSKEYYHLQKQTKV
jgi:hypothetical protein